MIVQEGQRCSYLALPDWMEEGLYLTSLEWMDESRFLCLSVPAEPRLLAAGKLLRGLERVNELMKVVPWYD